MNYDDILALVRAGYSKTEIASMGFGAAAPAPVPPTQQPAAPEPPKESPAPAVPPQAQAQPPQAQPLAATSTEALLQQLFGSVNTLTQAVQAQNRAAITGITPAQTSEEIARNATARMMGVTEKE